MTRIEKTATASLVLSFLLLAGVMTRSYVLSRHPDPAAVPMVKIGEVVKLPVSSYMDVFPGPAYVNNCGSVRRQFSVSQPRGRLQQRMRPRQQLHRPPSVLFVNPS